MKTFAVRLPITGFICAEVEAQSEKEAIELALDTPFTTGDIERWDTTEYVTQGNVCYAMLSRAEADEIDGGDE